MASMYFVKHNIVKCEIEEKTLIMIIIIYKMSAICYNVCSNKYKMEFAQRRHYAKKTKRIQGKNEKNGKKIQ